MCIQVQQAEAKLTIVFSSQLPSKASIRPRKTGKGFFETATTFVSGKDALFRASEKREKPALGVKASPTAAQQLTEALLQRGILSDLDETRLTAYFTKILRILGLIFPFAIITLIALYTILQC